MYADFKEAIVLLMQHPIMRKPISELVGCEREKAYELLRSLLDLSFDEDYTQTDNMQIARLEYNLGKLAYLLGKDNDIVIRHYSAALQSLEKGGFNLSIDKWAELVSLHTIEV